jgi:hypothetical protein
LPSERLDEEAIYVPSISALVNDPLDVLHVQLLEQALVKACELALVLARKVTHVKIIEVFEVIHGVDHLSRFIVYVEVSNSAGTRRDCGDLSGRGSDTKEVRLAFDSCFEVDRAASFGPLDPGWNEIEIFCRRCGRRTSRGWDDPYPGMAALFEIADESDGLAVRGPSRFAIALFVVGDLCECAPLGWDRPDIRIAAVIECTSASV